MCRKSEVIRRAYGSCLWSFCSGYVFLEQTKSQLLIHIKAMAVQAITVGAVFKVREDLV